MLHLLYTSVILLCLLRSLAIDCYVVKVGPQWLCSLYSRPVIPKVGSTEP